MITFIRSLSELMAMTESRDNPKNLIKNNDVRISTVDSGQRKRYLRSLNKSVSKLDKHIELKNQMRFVYTKDLAKKRKNFNKRDVA
mgnify:CR=1 FL=1|tara:strand:- start:418 stop:675 length:258 start_codon:yes stop_codon:yes gene_type:complete